VVFRPCGTWRTKCFPGVWVASPPGPPLTAGGVVARKTSPPPLLGRGCLPVPMVGSLPKEANTPLLLGPIPSIVFYPPGHWFRKGPPGLFFSWPWWPPFFLQRFR